MSKHKQTPNKSIPEDNDHNLSDTERNDIKPKATKEVIEVDSDSDDCLIVESVVDGGTDGRQQLSDGPDMTGSEDVIPDNSGLKDDSKEKIKQSMESMAQSCGRQRCQVSDETIAKTEPSIDVKNEIKLEIKPKIELKPKIEIKDENNVRPSLEIDMKELEKKYDKYFRKYNIVDKCQKSVEVKDTKEISIQTEDIDDNEWLEFNSSSDLSSDSETESDDNSGVDYILSAIERVKSNHQKPTFDRIFTQFKKMKFKYAKPNDGISLEVFTPAFNEALKQKLIEKIVGNGSDDIAYQPMNYSRKRRRTTSSSNSANNANKWKRRFSGEESVKRTNGSTNCVNIFGIKPNEELLSSQTDFEGLVTNEYCDIEDIDITSSHLFADAEIDPQLFETDPTVCDVSSVSKSLNSSPIRSFNHNMNSKVKRNEELSALCTPTTSTASRETEITPNDFKDWLLEVLPRSSPFIAQRGDRVVYLRDAHVIYINYERKQLLEQYPKKLCSYEEISNAIKTDDYIINATIIDVKFYQLNYIKFSVIRLKSESTVDPFEFNVLYRPNRCVSEFLVLQQIYEESQKNEWRPGSEFRSLWHKLWWEGVIIKRSVFNKRYPNSLFKCFQVKWNTGEEGQLSPWDVFTIDVNRKPKHPMSGIPVTKDELFQMNYKSICDEWPEVNALDSHRWRYYELKRIYFGLKYIEKRIKSSIIDVFIECRHSEISYSINYLIIKERLKNLFYRRKESVIYDISCLKSNCKLYLNSKDFKSAEELVDLILCIANDTDVCREEQLKDLIDNYKHLTQPISHCDLTSSLSPTYASLPSQRSVPSLLKKAKSQNTSIDSNDMSSKKKAVKRPNTSQTPLPPKMLATEDRKWITDSTKFIEELLKNEKSLPFREPVNTDVHTDYLARLEMNGLSPMDLSLIETKLSTDHYINPIEMRNDFRNMFENSISYNTDSKSLIRKYTKELKSYSEDKLREIVTDWERVLSYEKRKKEKSGARVREPTSRNQLWGFGKEQYY